MCIRYLIFCFCFISCAGPIMPFGSVNLYSRTQVQEAQRVNSHIDGKREGNFRKLASSVPIFFSQEPKLLFHKPYSFNISLPSQVDAKPMMMLDGDIIPFEILSNITKERKGELTEYKINDIKLSSHSIYDLKILLVDRYGQSISKYALDYPECKVFQKEKLDNLWTFEVDAKLERLLKQLDEKVNISSVLLASIVAQESAFNPKALSWAKAVGLTQVTSIAQKEVSELNPHWPVDNRLNKNKYLSVKWLLERDRITAKDDWRLDLEKSLIGGSLFLEKVVSYWQIPENAELLTELKSFDQKEFLSIILASYNSGPFRVKMQIRRLGEDWLKSKKLTEARKYVQNIFSYCHEFKQKKQLVSYR